MLPYFSISSLRSLRQSIIEKSKKEKAQSLLKLRVQANRRPPIYPDDYWWKKFFEHSDWMVGAVPVEHRAWLEGFVSRHLPKEKQVIYTEPSGRYMFAPWGLQNSFINGPDHPGKTHKEMWDHGLVRAFQYGNESTAVLWGGGSLIGDDIVTLWDELHRYTGIITNNLSDLRFYHFFQCAKGYSPPTSVILGWTKKGRKFHEDKTDSVLKYIPTPNKSYFVMEESFPTGLIRSKKEGFRGVFNPKRITFPNCVHRFSTSQLGSK